MTAFATPEQFVTATGGDLSELDDSERARITAVLESASDEFRGILVRYAIYRTAPGSALPIDSWVLDALAKATCAQAQWFEEIGGVSGAQSRYDNIRAGSTALSRNAGSANASSVASDRVAPQALTILMGASDPITGALLFPGAWGY